VDRRSDPHPEILQLVENKTGTQIWFAGDQSMRGARRHREVGRWRRTRCRAVHRCAQRHRQKTEWVRQATAAANQAVLLGI